jgi:hypothetical protein
VNAGQLLVSRRLPSTVRQELLYRGGERGRVEILAYCPTVVVVGTKVRVGRIAHEGHDRSPHPLAAHLGDEL